MKKVELMEFIQEQNPAADLELLGRAFDYAEHAHAGQVRKSGNPYFEHPKATAYKLAQLRLDDATIAAGLLHDVPEDTTYTLKDVKKEFGGEIAFLVEGVTKLSVLKYRGMERYIENLRRMFMAMAKDIRVIMIKLCDRIHNLETLAFLPPEKQYRIALESLEIYAPIANRLGIGDLKGQIEDLAFPYVYPEEYKWLMNTINITLREKEKHMVELKNNVEKLLQQHHVPYLSVHGRTKRLYSLYKKLLKHDRDITKIYDLVALRVIVDSVSRCYETLGIIHTMCPPLKGRIKDYVAQPKPNGYQSLHTTVFTPQREIAEIQIRSRQMHEANEYGIAAHWHYKETARSKTLPEKFAWVSQLATLQKEISDGTQYLESLKIDIFQNRIFIFTPKGDVIDLPEDATPIDFAYHIHSDLGNKCSGVRVNGQMAALDTTLKSGDVVEIIIDKNRTSPNADWLKFVKTNSTKKRIHQKLNHRRLQDRFRLLRKK